MNFDFSNTKYLYFLFAIPFIVFFYFYSVKKTSGKAVRFANFEAIARIKGVDIYSRNISIFLLDILIVLALVFSLSGLNVYMDKQGSSFSYLIALDSSESMGAKDILPNRFEVAKDTAVNFITSLPSGTNVGIISFSGNSFIEQEFISDKNVLVGKVNQINLTDVGGTDIFELITLSILLFKNEDNRAIILLSDGQLNMGDVSKATENAIDNHIVIDTFGLGTIEGGETSFGISKIDEESLKLIANKTGGKYFNVNNREELDRSFGSVVDLKVKAVKFSLTFYLLILAIILFILREFLMYFGRVSI